MSSDIHALSGAYAVDALDDIERAQFERHLAECATCRSEVDSLREASAVLAEAAFVAPPPALRDRVLAGIETVRPLPPVVSPAAERRKRRFSALVAAAAVITLIGAGVAVTRPWQDETTQVPQLSAAERVLQAPDAETWTKSPVTGGTIKVTRSLSLNQAVVQATGLARLPEGKAYELWLQHDGEMVAAGLMTDESPATVVLEGDPGTAEATAVSVEPAAGSPKPTTFPIAIFEFEQV